MESVQCVMGARMRRGLLPRSRGIEYRGLEPYYTRTVVRSDAGFAKVTTY